MDALLFAPALDLQVRKDAHTTASDVRRCLAFSEMDLILRAAAAASPCCRCCCNLSIQRVGAPFHFSSGKFNIWCLDSRDNGARQPRQSFSSMMSLDPCAARSSSSSHCCGSKISHFFRGLTIFQVLYMACAKVLLGVLKLWNVMPDVSLSGKSCRRVKLGVGVWIITTRPGPAGSALLVATVGLSTISSGQVIQSAAVEAPLVTRSKINLRIRVEKRRPRHQVIQRQPAAAPRRIYPSLPMKLASHTLTSSSSSTLICNK